jgi:hypothetical protein
VYLPLRGRGSSRSARESGAREWPTRRAIFENVPQDEFRLPGQGDGRRAVLLRSRRRCRIRCHQEKLMAAMTDVLIPALEDAREAHAAVVDRFRTDVTFTPPGVHRQRLERQVDEAQDHLERIEERVRAMRPPRGLLSVAGQLMRITTRGAVRASLLPLEVGVSAVTEVVRGQKPANERRLLKNTEDEYAAAAWALATCRAGKDIAEQLHDPARRRHRSSGHAVPATTDHRLHGPRLGNAGRPPVHAREKRGSTGPGRWPPARGAPGWCS